MARGIQADDVFQAADALLLAGERPTIERVLDQWFAQLGARIRDPQAFSPSAGVPDPVQQAAKHFWEAALAAAREACSSDYAQEASVLSERTSALEDAERNSLLREAELEQRTIDLSATIQLAQDRSADAAAAAVAARAETEAGRVAVQRLQEEALLLQTQIRDLRLKLDEERNLWDAERKEMIIRADAGERRAAAEIDRARVETRNLTAEVDSLGKNLRKSTDEIFDLRKQLSDSEIRSIYLAETLHDKAAALNETEKRLSETVSDWQARLQTAQSEVTQLSQARRDDREQADLLRSFIAAIPKPGVRARKSETKTTR
jgi:gas vesicle protein